ncbi:MULTISPECIES: FMN-binding negative transcriptional regulator [Exiguobacterium]|uniref:FMN-binding negative transcriptional regulator n=1 Tax=Exiguobacterium TaxID=33986 RepID=UPI001BE83E28|nr:MULTISPECIES: FMN-binding negative transcriptional regulator [Exiguobacterium]MCT4783406.1 FMN-binding negative transcriptional regulator [Exiguobacterium himgiriensis]
MYVPKQYAVNDPKEVQAFLQAHPFGTVISHDGEKPIATHVPLRLHETDGQLSFTTPIAKANPQWKTIEQQTVLVIVQGPDAYVSASWYGHEDVSTWNYQAVHLYGKATIMTEAELEDELAGLLRDHEGERKNAVVWEELSEPVKRQKYGVVGFRIDVSEIEAAFKLSQNRNDEDYERIVSELEQEGCPMADVMRAHKK